MNGLFPPVALAQGWWQMWAEMQKNWLGLWQQGMAAGMSGMASLPGATGMSMAPWLAAGPLSGMMPQVDARITPLETKGSLAGTEDAARISLRMAMPGCMGPAEMLLVEAVVARVSAVEAPLLNEIAPDLLSAPEK